jgi:cystathionine beta-lyase/cystathionine gamma-synthase
VYVEMPTNPTLRIPDPVPALERARAAGVPAVIDATFASPIHLRAHALGFDVIIHSATKYLGGHSDLIGGVVAGPSALVGRVNAMMRLYGPSADPHMVWLLDRGLRTLDVRMRRHDANARAVAAFLDGHPAVETAIHPSLPHHPDHARARQLLPEGTGGMVSFVLRGGASAAERFMAALRWIHEAPSLGGVESLASEPRRTSHASMTPRQRAEAGIPDGFIRLSIGIEDEADLIEDLDAALAASRR